ncbi:centromere protein J [Anopheles bellator]|uniref:centromere protein J n=1 Tax=Anopheles bellator TaxID=139047 RepID=UPI0026496B11|nr:centromere protein J [Anopheles bellator]
MADSPRSILARLEQLKKWQEEQQRVLLEKHIAQQQLLEQEQHKMYEVLGLQQLTVDDDEQVSFQEDSDSEPEYEETNLEAQLAFERIKPANVDNNESTFRTSNANIPSLEPKGDAPRRNLPKKPYLKRGEGLRTRFRVDPDKFKLDNLPKYKFANHNRDRINRKLGAKRDASNRADELGGTDPKTLPVAKPTRVDSVRVDTKTKTTDTKPRNRSEAGIVLDVNRVQEKKLKVPARQGGSLPGVNVDPPTGDCMANLVNLVKQSFPEPVKGPHKQTDIVPNAPWKRQLDPASSGSKEQRELNFFELLEQKVVGKSFNSNSSSILRFIASNDSTACELTTMTQDDGGCAQLEIVGPLVHRGEIGTIDCISPGPSKVVAMMENDSDASDTETDDEDEQGHVRFADDATHHGSDATADDHESILGMKAMALSKMSTPNNKFTQRSESFEQTGSSSESDQSDDCSENEPTDNGQSDREETAVPNTDDDTLRGEILAKSELLKERLAELEREIDSYRRENAELIRAKQDHEMERLKLQQDREEQEERLADERIKMEVYFHDERMKIESERKQALREAQKPNRKDRDEILRLTDELAEARQHQKEREAKHSASLARFRAQAKTVEKDLQEVRLELEVLKKDNRRLETENARLKRQNNSRMLVEINRNIAKLAEGNGEQREGKPSPESDHKPSARGDGSDKQTMAPANNGTIRARTVQITERNVRVPQTKAKVMKHLSTHGRQPTVVAPIKRGSSVPMMHITDASSETDENDENNRLAGRRYTMHTKRVSSDEDDFSDDDNEEQNEMQGEDSSSALQDGDGHQETSPYFTNPPTVRKTLFNAVRAPSHPGIGGLVRKEDKPSQEEAKGNTSNARTAEATEVMKSLKKEIVHSDGSREIRFPNGNIKKISPDGLTIRMQYFNKDIKETNVSEGTTKYYYSETGTWRTTYLDGLEITEFPNGQREHLFKDGSTEVHFPNGSIRTTNPNSVDIAEEWKYHDGTTMIIRKNGDKEISLPNGQVEIQTKAHKRRIYPDGTVKYVYPDGSQESRYSNGRVRLKDKDGRLVSDTGGAGSNW